MRQESGQYVVSGRESGCHGWLTGCLDQRPPGLDTSYHLVALLSHLVLGSPAARSASVHCRRYSSTPLDFPDSSVSVTAGMKSRLQDLGPWHA